MADKVPAIYGAIHKVQSDLGPIGKDGDYDTGRVQYSFVSANQVISKVRPLLNEHKIIMTTQLVEEDHTFFTAEPTGAKAPQHNTHAFATYKFDFISVEDGSAVTTTVLADATDTGDKSSRNLAVSATKIALLQQFVAETSEPDSHELNTLGREGDGDGKPTAASRKVSAARTTPSTPNKTVPKAAPKPASKARDTNAAKDEIRIQFIETGKCDGPEINELIQAKKTELGQAKAQTSTYEAVLADLKEKFSDA